MQLTRHTLVPLVRALGACGLAACAALPAVARAQVVEVATSHTVYHEAPTRTNMTVYTPGLTVKASPFRWLDVKGGYEADVVSGASVSTKAGKAYQAVNPGADVISTASVHDFRQKANGGLVFKHGDSSLSGGFTYSTENDYKGRNISLGAHTEAYDHNTQFDLGYSKSFDSVCDRVQPSSATSTRFLALESSTGCFTSAPLRTTKSVDSDSFQASWTQAWTKIFLTQLVYSGQLLDGFQSNPYRSVIIGQGVKAQESHPENRARHSLTLRASIYLRPLQAALKLSVRGYTDSWGINGGNVEGEFEKYVADWIRLGVRGRLYKQSAALFYSDDYTGGDAPLGPKGQYFSGDRELSPFTSVLLGARARFLLPTHGKRIAKIFHSVEFGGGFDVVQFFYDQYTLAGTPLSNARSYLANLNALVTF